MYLSIPISQCTREPSMQILGKVYFCDLSLTFFFQLGIKTTLNNTFECLILSLQCLITALHPFLTPEKD